MQHKKRSDGGGQENEGRKHSGKHHFYRLSLLGVNMEPVRINLMRLFFPDVPAMVDSLHNMYDLKVVLTMWP